MPKIDIADVPVDATSFYPAPFRQVVHGREKKRLGNEAGLTQFGVNLARLKPGAASALRHWHHAEDEFIYVLEGELVLQENEGEMRLTPGDAAGFKAGVANGHCLINRSGRDAIYLEIGTRSAREEVDYPDADLRLKRDPAGPRYLRRSGEPYPKG